MDPLTPSAFFSPSKAAQQRAKAHDAHQLDLWLSSLYNPASRPGGGPHHHGSSHHATQQIPDRQRQPPSFERNDDTIAALLTLAAANERADEEEAELERLEIEELKEFEEQAADADTEIAELDASILELLADNMTDEARVALDALSTLTWVANVADCNPATLAHAFTTQSLSHLTLRNSTLAATALNHHLTAEHAATAAELQSLRSRSQSQSHDSSANAEQRAATDYAHQTKHLKLKLREYEERLAKLQPMQPSSSSSADTVGTTTTVGRKGGPMDVHALAAREDGVLALERAVEEVEARVGAYRGLPVERQEARKVVEGRRRELETLKAKRDDLFERLVGR